MPGPSQAHPTRGGSAPAGVMPPPLPPAPEFERRVRFKRAQVLGVLALAIVPFVGALGVLGPTVGATSDVSEAIAVRVEYPAVQRFKMRMPLRMLVTNTGREPVRLVEVVLEGEYVAAFSDVAFTLGPDRIENGDYVFVLSGVEPLQTRVITLEMQAQRYGRHEAHLTWHVFDGAGAPSGGGSLAFATVNLP